MSAIKIKNDYKLKAKNRRTKKPYEKKQYQVDQLRSQCRNCGDEFLVKWKDCKETENSWVHKKDISPDLIDLYAKSDYIYWFKSSTLEDKWTGVDENTAKTIDGMYVASIMDGKDYYLTTTTKHEDGSVTSVEHKFQFGKYIRSHPTNDPTVISIWKRVLSDAQL